MTLPASLDPQAVAVAASFLRAGLRSCPHALTGEQRDELVRRGVALLLSRGAHVVGDELILPARR